MRYAARMADPSDSKTTQTPAERLAALVAQKKASQGQGHPGAARPNERAAAARSASKSKPATRK